MNLCNKWLHKVKASNKYCIINATNASMQIKVPKHNLCNKWFQVTCSVMKFHRLEANINNTCGSLPAKLHNLDR